MSNFNNNEYEHLVKDLIGDIFYTETSYRGKISTIRQYAEIITRKLLDIKPEEMLTLGNSKIRKRILSLQNHEYIESSLEVIRTKGNLSTHTQHLEQLTSSDFELIIDSLFNLLSSLLINFFEKYPFGTSNEVMYSFSILPPIIRYKVLDFLYEKNPENIMIIDKYVLAMMKAYSIETAEYWIESNKESILQMDVMSEKAYNDLVSNIGLETAEAVRSMGPSSMYHLCKEKIEQVGATIEHNGLLYTNFESALPHYESKGILVGDKPEFGEFNDLMNFLYLGRKGELKELSEQTNPYIILNMN